MKKSVTLSIFGLSILLLFLQIILTSTAAPSPSSSSSQNEETVNVVATANGPDQSDIESMVQVLQENEKMNVNPLSFSPFARRLFLLKLQHEQVKRSRSRWRQCTFNAVSCFGR